MYTVSLMNCIPTQQSQSWSNSFTFYCCLLSNSAFVCNFVKSVSKIFVFVFVLINLTYFSQTVIALVTSINEKGRLYRSALQPCSLSTGGWTPPTVLPLHSQVFMSHFTPGQACGEATQLSSYRWDLLTSPRGHCQVFIVNCAAKPQLTKKR